MNLRDARALARAIQETYGCACTVPYGYGPDNYFARIWTSRPSDLDPDPLARVPSRPVDFWSMTTAHAWFRRAEELEEEWKRKYKPRPRSPLDILIDRAVGLE